MSYTAIKVENLGKSYMVGHNAPQTERYFALRDVMARNAKNLARKTRDMLQGRAIVQGDEVEEFWALKDVNFEIKQGDRVGIIGRNGAGKSTLLKVLSRITEPTAGRITINGRVASLLEVGTGFHPELTGRENIFLNGAILGMSRKEIQRKFDEIVDFAEVERFLDTPVKRYSSGMYVRLAFAVAAHLESEILVVDEVLAVGDVAFQKKCLSKMDSVSTDGRTVLFVSHNMESIGRLCSRYLVLANGSLQLDSKDMSAAVKNYFDDKSRNIFNQSNEKKSIYIEKNEFFDILEVNLSQSDRVNQFSRLLPIDLHIHINSKSIPSGISIGYYLYNEEGSIVYSSYTTDESEYYWPDLALGKSILHTQIPAKLLNFGFYTIEIVAAIHKSQWIIQKGRSNIVQAFSMDLDLSDSPYWTERRDGCIAPVMRWTKKNTLQQII